MNRSETKQAFWHEHIEGWKQSRESQKDYCRAHGLCLPTFGYWKRKLKCASEAPTPPQQLVEVPRLESGSRHGEGLVLRLRDGIEIPVTHETDPELLVRVLNLLGADRSRC